MANEVQGLPRARGRRHPPPQRRLLPRPLPRARHATRSPGRSRSSRCSGPTTGCSSRSRGARIRSRCGTSSSTSGTTSTGFYLDLGIGGYSNAVQGRCRFPSPRVARAKLIVRSLEAEHGFTVPELSTLTGRVPCSGCGLNKRYEFNRAALEEGFDILVTGHNLDDEVATLFGNVLHWNTDMLGRQVPVLEERILGDGDDAEVALVRKAKPLVRLPERETAAYALLRGIDYVIEECPMVEGNTQHRYKEAITLLEEARRERSSQMYFGFLQGGRPLRDSAENPADDSEVVACASCGAPTVASRTQRVRGARSARRRTSP